MPYRTIDDLYGSSPAPPPWEVSRPVPDSRTSDRPGEGRLVGDENWMLELEDEVETVRVLIAEGGDE
jgi:hypothetical protein